LNRRILIMTIAMVTAGCATNEVQPPAEVPKVVENQVPIYLERAFTAYQENRLLVPAQSNARFWYSKVIELEPNNLEARRGLEMIMARYHENARRAIVKQHFGVAADNLMKADEVIVNHSETLEIAAQLANAQQHSAQAAHSWQLNDRDLRRKNAAIQAQLRSIAVKIRQLDAPATIYAPTDSLGRWVYVQLNNQSLSYRVRGDLRISDDARIEIR